MIVHVHKHHAVCVQDQGTVRVPRDDGRWTIRAVDLLNDLFTQGPIRIAVSSGRLPALKRGSYFLRERLGLPLGFRKPLIRTTISLDRPRSASAVHGRFASSPMLIEFHLFAKGASREETP
jgi:hypothetical protein